MTKEENRSADQARAQLETIEQWHRVHEWANNWHTVPEPKDLSREDRKWLLDEMDWAHDPDHEAVVDAIRDLVIDDPLELQVRSEWHSLGEIAGSGEFRILLCTGGPAVRITGRLVDSEPSESCIEHQDWGTPWTELEDSDCEALDWYASQFNWEEA